MESLDHYIGTNVVVPGTKGIEPVLAHIKGRKRDQDGIPIGTENQNPILDTRVYQLEFPDGRIEEYALNVIIENIMNQVDADGYDVGIFDEIISHRCNEEVAIMPGIDAETNINGITKPVITTKGWDLQIRWKDQSTSWIPLSSIKESFPVQAAEYAVANNIAHMPAFKWWVKPVLRKRNNIIAKLNTTRPHRKGRMKFGVIVP